ncbi:MAG: helix-turn-helix domain-containing protein [Pseudomonadota bacterium]
MPRMSEAEKQRSHGRILDAAGKMFRERGIESTSVADIMKAAGMTHGGFYRHFSSKDELVAAAFKHAVDHVVSDMERQTSPAEQDGKREEYVSTYLSDEHVKNRAQGCPLAAMGAELARGDGLPRKQGADATSRMASLLQTREAPDTAQGRAIMALLLGTITLARLSETEDGVAKALEAGRAGLHILENDWPKV